MTKNTNKYLKRMSFNISKEELENLYIKQELSGLEIGKIFNVGSHIIINRLKRHKIPTRLTHTEKWKIEASKRSSGSNNGMYGRKGNLCPAFGRKASDETRRKISEHHADNGGKNHPLFGKHHSEKSKKQISDTRKGKHYPKYSERMIKLIKEGKWINPMLGKNHTDESKLKMSLKRKGMCLLDKNPNWHGGVSKLPYSFNFTENLKEEIRKRDNYLCKLCGKSANNEESLSIHHIDYDKKNTNKNNLVSLCKKCHGKTNSNREYWKHFFDEPKEVDTI